MLLPFKKIVTMGVVNITPNSFSESNAHIDLLKDSQFLEQKLKLFKTIKGLVYDFGFESTAPMNSAITAHEERARFDLFFETFAHFDFNDEWISLDTYRPDNYLYFEEKFKSRYSGCGFIFNDVSGVLDSELISLLQSKSTQENFYYILNSTHIPSRDHVNQHMQFKKTGDIIKQSLNFFNNGLLKLRPLGINHKIILDPGFGFSKSYEQNWDLINRCDELFFGMENICPWLIGISKKSFLRSALPETHNPFLDSEVLHAKVMTDVLKKSTGQVIFRAHDPFLVERSHALLSVN